MCMSLSRAGASRSLLSPVGRLWCFAAGACHARRLLFECKVGACLRALSWGRCEGVTAYCLSGGAQGNFRQQMLVQLTEATAASGGDTSPAEWLDAEGSSLIRTLGKAWGEYRPGRLAKIFEILVVRHLSPTAGRKGDPAVSQTCALAVAYILPIISEYTPPLLLTSPIHPLTLPSRSDASL